MKWRASRKSSSRAWAESSDKSAESQAEPSSATAMSASFSISKACSGRRRMPNSLVIETGPEITRKEFLALRAYLHATVGIELRDGKEQLVMARLSKFVRSGGHSSFDQYFKFV